VNLHEAIGHFRVLSEGKSNAKDAKDVQELGEYLKTRKNRGFGGFHEPGGFTGGDLDDVFAYGGRVQARRLQSLVKKYGKEIEAIAGIKNLEYRKGGYQASGRAAFSKVAPWDRAQKSSPSLHWKNV
jgi:hypothetical protein